MVRERERVEPLERAVLRVEPLAREAFRVERLRRVPPVRCDAGTSAWTTALVSDVICFSRNVDIRSSSRRIWRATFAVSLSPTFSAKAWIDR